MLALSANAGLETRAIASGTPSDCIWPSALYVRRLAL